MRHLSFFLLFSLCGLFFHDVGINVAVGDDVDALDFDDENAADLMQGLDADEELLDAHDPLAAETQATTVAPPPTKTIQYSAPSVSGLEFVEAFDGDVFSRWTRSSNERFTGQWKVTRRQQEAIVGDVGLRVMDQAHHHGIATKLSTPIVENKGKPLVLSYEVKYEEEQLCGGSYLKLFNTASMKSKGKDMSEFDNETPYVVMFGPDRCGLTNKVHFIVKQLNPISQKWVEHHLVDPPRVPHSKTTHLFGFVITPDNMYKILVDGKVEKEGNMKTDFDPAFTPSMEIDDPEDNQPDDWVEEDQIVDPSATKPEDWDEDAPRTIADPSASMPKGWLEDEPTMVTDTNAKEPEFWNEEDDGKWEAPEVPNPLCSIGCGKWTAPQIPNPAYKGKWVAPMIPNPDYQGPWSPKQIPNPDYFVSENPHALADFDAVGFELWTMQKGILFDNIVIARSVERVEDFVAHTFSIRHEIESGLLKSATPKATDALNAMNSMEKVATSALIFATERPFIFAMAVLSIVSALIMGLIKLLKKRRSSVPEPVDALKASSTEEETKASENSDETKPSGEEEEEELVDKKSTTSPSTRQRRPKKE